MTIQDGIGLFALPDGALYYGDWRQVSQTHVPCRSRQSDMTPEGPTELLGVSVVMDESDHCCGVEFLRGSVPSTTAARLPSRGHQGLACRTAEVLIASVSFFDSMGT